MNIKKNIFSRIARRKEPTPLKPVEEGLDLPPPTAIEPGVPYSAEDTEGKDYGSHQELELLASDEPPRTDSMNGADAGESGPAPALESALEPISNESPDAPEQHSDAAPYEEYDLELETLTESGSKASPGEPNTSLHESSLEGEVAAAEAVESVLEVSPPEPETPQESEPEAIDETVVEDKQELTATVSKDSPDEEELPFEIEDAASAAADSAVEVTAPEPEISRGKRAGVCGRYLDGGKGTPGGVGFAGIASGAVPGRARCGKRYSPSRKRCPWELAARQGLQPERVAGSGPWPR